MENRRANDTSLWATPGDLENMLRKPVPPPKDGKATKKNIETSAPTLAILELHSGFLDIHTLKKIQTQCKFINPINPEVQFM